jgi:serine/threonine-protein kinase
MTASAYPGPFKQGDEFGNYRIQGLLGQGGHAFVYAAQHKYMERLAAIKVIPAPVGADGDVYKRARLEANVLAQLEHPNVVKVYDAGVTDEGLVYIAMEMLQGQTLRAALISCKKFTVSETLHVGLQVAEAVKMAHSVEAIHRDLKPENVFILPGNVAKVLDFGITKFLGSSAHTTQPNIICGTPQYMAPEHLQGLEVTVQSDIYAFGSVLYELLTAVPPALIGLKECSSFAIGYSQIHRMPPRLDEVTDTVPRYVARAIQRMLAKVPEERQASMADVVKEILSLQERLSREAQEPIKPMRELWQPANRDASRPADVHETKTPIANIVHTNQVTAAVAGLAANVPAETKPLAAYATERPSPPIVFGSFGSSSKHAEPMLGLDTLKARQIVAGAERIIAMRKAAEQRPSVSAPGVEKPAQAAQPGSSRMHDFRLPHFALATAVGLLLGYCAVVAIRHVMASPDARASLAPAANAQPSAATSASVNPTTAAQVQASSTANPTGTQAAAPSQAPASALVQVPPQPNNPNNNLAATGVVRQTAKSTSKPKPQPWLSEDHESPWAQPNDDPPKKSSAKPAAKSKATPKPPFDADDLP